jgi:hypothetical protein
MMVVSFELGLQVAMYINHLLLQTLHRPPIQWVSETGKHNVHRNHNFLPHLIGGVSRF